MRPQASEGADTILAGPADTNAPVASLLRRAARQRVGVAVKAGLQSRSGEGCCVTSPLDGAGFSDDAFADACCAH